MTNAAPSAAEHAPLKRELGVVGATVMGLSAIIGAGVFVSIGLAAGAAGPSVILAILLAALVAACNALSSAQLAANHAVSGGTYEFGYRYLGPAFGFAAGWTFLCAKTASAAAAALGFAGYLLALTGGDPALRAPLAAGAAIAITALTLAGLKRTNAVNIAIATITIGALVAFLAAGAPELARGGGANFTPFFPETEAAPAFLYATALMFVAYAGFARVATLGEEVKAPRVTIPRAIIATLLISAALYAGVAFVAIGTVGAGALAAETARAATPLEAAARALAAPWAGPVVAVGAVTAMLGVLLNLVLGLSRVALAMGRRGDLPPLLASLTKAKSVPAAATIVVGAAIALFAALGGVETAWAFSAFTILLYYAITNLAALRLKRSERLYPPIIAWCGLASCVCLAFFVPPPIWLTGLALLAAGLAWRAFAKRVGGRGAAG